MGVWGDALGVWGGSNGSGGLRVVLMGLGAALGVSGSFQVDQRQLGLWGRLQRAGGHLEVWG